MMSVDEEWKVEDDTYTGDGNGESRDRGNEKNSDNAATYARTVGQVRVHGPILVPDREKFTHD